MSAVTNVKQQKSNVIKSLPMSKVKVKYFYFYSTYKTQQNASKCNNVSKI